METYLIIVKKIIIIIVYFYKNIIIKIKNLKNIVKNQRNPFLLTFANNPILKKKKWEQDVGAILAELKNQQGKGVEYVVKSYVSLLWIIYLK